MDYRCFLAVYTLFRLAVIKLELFKYRVWFRRTICVNRALLSRLSGKKSFNNFLTVNPRLDSARNVTSWCPVKIYYFAAMVTVI